MRLINNIFSSGKDADKILIITGEKSFIRYKKLLEIMKKILTKNLFTKRYVCDIITEQQNILKTMQNKLVST